MGSLPFAPGADLDVAYRKSVQALEAAGRIAYEPELLNQSLLSRKFGRIILALDDPRPTLIYVCSAPWTNALLGPAVTDLINGWKAGAEMGGAPDFALWSAHPVPPVVATMFDNSPIARREIELRTKFRVQDPMPTEEMPGLAVRFGSPLIQELTGKPAPAAPSTIAQIQTAILSLRPEKDASKPFPDDAAAPDAVFLALGALLGECLASTPGVETAWINHQALPLSVGIAIRNATSGAQYIANPVGKAKKLYLFGKEHDLPAFAQSMLAQIGLS